MATQELMDASGHLLGKVYVQSDGRLGLIGKDGRTKGFYDPRTDETIDASGQLVGRGNLLTMLL